MEALDDPDCNDFVASDGWLGKLKLSYRIREKNIQWGESFDVPTTTIESWMERFERYLEYG